MSRFAIQRRARSISPAATVRCDGVVAGIRISSSGTMTFWRPYENSSSVFLMLRPVIEVHRPEKRTT